MSDIENKLYDVFPFNIDEIFANLVYVSDIDTLEILYKYRQSKMNNIEILKRLVIKYKIPKIPINFENFVYEYNRRYRRIHICESLIEQLNMAVKDEDLYLINDIFKDISKIYSRINPYAILKKENIIDLSKIAKEILVNAGKSNNKNIIDLVINKIHLKRYNIYSDPNTYVVYGLAFNGNITIVDINKYYDYDDVITNIIYYVTLGIANEVGSKQYELLENIKNINIKDELLYIEGIGKGAAISGNIKLLESLFKLYEFPEAGTIEYHNFRSDVNDIMFKYSLRSGNVDVINLIYKKCNIKLNPTDQRDILKNIAKGGHISSLDWFINHAKYLSSIDLLKYIVKYDKLNLLVYVYKKNVSKSNTKAMFDKSMKYGSTKIMSWMIENFKYYNDIDYLQNKMINIKWNYYNAKCVMMTFDNIKGIPDVKLYKKILYEYESLGYEELIIWLKWRISKF